MLHASQRDRISEEFSISVHIKVYNRKKKKMLRVQSKRRDPLVFADLPSQVQKMCRCDQTGRKKVWKRAADMDGLDSGSQNSRKFVVTARFGSFWEQAGVPLLVLVPSFTFVTRLCFSRLSHFTCFHCSHDRGNESARFTNFLDVIPRYDRWGFVILLEHIYIYSLRSKL